MSKKTLNVDQVMSELKGQSVFFRPAGQPAAPSPPPLEKETDLSQTPTSEVTDSRTSEETKLASSELTDIRTYELRNYANFRRLDIRLTADQKRFLTDLEERIRSEMPEGEANNPNSKRITKNSIIRVFIEIFRHLDLKLDASHFMNEIDLLQSIYASLLAKLRDSRTSEVTD